MSTFHFNPTLLLSGKRLARAVWTPGSFIYLVPGSEFAVNRRPLLGIFPEGTCVKYRQHIDIRHADGTFGVWDPTQDDLLAADWIILNN